MSKISIDIESIRNSLESIGYIISDCIERDNNGFNWQFKFSNSGSIVTIYDTNNKKNTVVNGRCDVGEQEALKEIVDGLKCKELNIDPLNAEIVSLINARREQSNYDFKRQWHDSGHDGSLLHDILCLANNIDNKDAFLIIGVTNSFEIVGVQEWLDSSRIYDFLRSKSFAGGNMPDVELRKIIYKFKKIDVLMIKSSKKVPFYLEKNYKDVGTQIYTRVGDTNTPKNEKAKYNDVEQLWRIHFS